MIYKLELKILVSGENGEPDGHTWMAVAVGEFLDLDDALEAALQTYPEHESRIGWCTPEEYEIIMSEMPMCEDCQIGRLMWTGVDFECSQCGARQDDIC